MNKHFYNLTLGLAAAAALGLASCADDAAAPDTPGTEGEGRTVWMTVDVSRGPADPDPASRLTHTEAQGYLDADWEKDDYIYVFTDGNQLVGQLDFNTTITNTDGANGGHTATFSGELNLPADFTTGSKVHLWYVGKQADGTRRTCTQGQNLVIDLSSQAGSFASMAYNDIMSRTDLVVKLEGDVISYDGTVNMHHRAAFAHFKTNLPQGSVVTISSTEKEFVNKFTITSVGRTSIHRDPFTATVQSEGNLYVTLCSPDAKHSLTLTSGNKIFTLEQPSDPLIPGRYYTDNWNTETKTYDGITADFKIKVLDAENKGDTGNWGGPNMTPKATPSTTGYSKVSSDIWYQNQYMFDDYGYCQPFTYEYNGIYDGLLSGYGASHIQSQDETAVQCVFYQWGRWIGFPPETCAHEIDFTGGGGNSSIFLYNATNTALGYIHRDGYDYWQQPTYAFHNQAYTSSSWTNDFAKKSAIVWLAPPQNRYTADYLNNNSFGSKYEDRCGNPCPPGYRIPTSTELANLIPTGGSFTTSHAEIKTINNETFAMQWKYLEETGEIEIRSVRTDASSVKVDDAIFSDATPIRFPFNDYIELVPPRGISNYLYPSWEGTGKEGLFWSSDSDNFKIGSYSGKGGVALHISVSGSTVEMEMTAVPYSYGACIVPVKDSSAVPTPCLPYFPRKLN